MTPLYRLSAGICIIIISLFFFQCGSSPDAVQKGSLLENNKLAEEQNGGRQPADIEVSEPSDPLSRQIPSENDLRNFAARINSDIHPVLDANGNPLVEIWQENNRIYGAVLCVQKEQEYRYSVLSDLSRMYDQESRQLFFVACIQGYRGDLFLASRTELGEFPVIDGYSSGPFGSSGAPMALNVSFQTSEGGEEYILFFNGGGTESLRLQQNSASHALQRDLDNDGIDDVLLYEAIYEEGTGKETFVSWYRWDGQGLSIYKTTTIIRRLNAYLKEAAGLLEEHSFDLFVSRFITPSEDRSVLLSLPFEEAFHRIFSPDRQMSIHVPIDRGAFALIRRVAFPNILENPFNLASKEYSVELPVHFIADRDYRYTIRLLMDSNPFAAHPFHFVLPQP